jgi:hypothetical protein
MRTKREIKQLRKDVQAIKEDLRVMKYERLDSLIAEMKAAAEEMLVASRIMVGKEPYPAKPSDPKADLKAAIDRGEFSDLTQEQLEALKSAVEPKAVQDEP